MLLISSKYIRKVALAAMLILFITHLFGQAHATSWFDVIPLRQDEKILAENNVQTIQIIDHYPDKSTELGSVVVVDSFGRTIEEVHLPVSDFIESSSDAFPDVKKYSYSDSLLVSTYEVQEAYGSRVDTIIRTYHYNSEGRLSEEVWTHSRWGGGKLVYGYDSTNRVKYQLTITNSGTLIKVDSTVLRDDYQPLLRIPLFNETGQFVHWDYDANGRIVAMKKCNSLNCDTIYRIRTFEYDGDRMVSEHRFYSYKGIAAEIVEPVLYRKFYYRSDGLLSAVKDKRKRWGYKVEYSFRYLNRREGRASR